MKIQTTDKVETPLVRALIYGAAKIGKTTLSKTAPKPLILSAEGGLLSLQDSSVEYAEIKSYDQLLEAYSELAKPESRTRWQTIILDSLSEIVDQILTTEKGKTKDGRLAYMATAEKMIKLIRSIRELPYNVVFICQEIEKDGKPQPFVHGATSCARIPYEFDLIMRMMHHDHNGQIYRVLSTEGDGFYPAGDRSGKLNAIEKADLSNIFAKATNQKTTKKQ